MNMEKLNKLCINITDGTHSSVIDNPNGNCFLLSCKNVKNGYVNISFSDRVIDELTLASLRKRTKMDKYDVVFTTVGTIGESSVIRTNNPNYEFQRSVAIIKTNIELLNPYYLHYYFSSSTGQQQISARIKGAAQPCLFLNDLKEIEIPLLPIIEQQHIVYNML